MLALEVMDVIEGWDEPCHLICFILSFCLLFWYKYAEYAVEHSLCILFSLLNLPSFSVTCPLCVRWASVGVGQRTYKSKNIFKTYKM